MKTCTVEGCSTSVHCRGLCNLHYRRLLTSQRMHPCACGCGEQTSYTYKHGHHTRLFTSEEQSRRGQMNNGDYKRDTGTADWYRKVRGRHEHRVVMERKLGRPLTSDEIVHHKDHNKKNNHPDNLEVMTRAEHFRHHLNEYWAAKRAGL